MPYHNGNRKTWIVTLPTRDGGRKRVSTGTTHRPTANRFEKMISDLGPNGTRAWDLLDRVAAGNLKLGAVFDAWNAGTLDALRAKLNDVDIEPFVALFLKRHSDRVSLNTVENYEQKLRLLIPKGKPFLRSSFTASTLDSFITNYDGRIPVKRKPGSPPAKRKDISSPTKRKVHAALSQFAKYLVRHAGLEHNPLRDIDPPPSNPPRIRYLEIVELLKLVETQREPFRTFAALLAGTGIDASTALPLKRRDLNEEVFEFRAPGTKSHTRDRVVGVAEWARRFVTDHVQALKPDDLLFPGVTVEQARKSHQAACMLCGIDEYTQKDHRHTYAVRAIRAGTPAEIVARQLGHRNTAMVTEVYARFAPNQEERAKWEKLAAANDAKAIEGAKKSADSNAVATIVATKPVLSLIRGDAKRPAVNAKRRANPKAHTALEDEELTGAERFELSTVALTVRCSAN